MLIVAILGLFAFGYMIEACIQRAADSYNRVLQELNKK
ncbi:hypothetical protein VPHD480_0124 [Vibrio phage D480]